MKIIVNQDIEIAGKRYAKGQEADAPEGLAAAFIAHGYASAVKAEKGADIETATARPVAETATAPRAKRATATA